MKNLSIFIQIIFLILASYIIPTIESRGGGGRGGRRSGGRSGFSLTPSARSTVYIASSGKSYKLKKDQKKSENFEKFTKGTALGGATFGKTLSKSKYIGMSKSSLKKVAIAGTAGLALGTTYAGFKIAEKTGKTLGKAYFMGMERVSYDKNRLNNDSEYHYMGQLNNYCDVWYHDKGSGNIDDNQEVMRCDKGYFYNYDKENVNSPLFDQNYTSWKVEPEDWTKQDQFLKICDQFSKEDEKIDYEAKVDQGTSKSAGEIVIYFLIVFCICGSYFC